VARAALAAGVHGLLIEVLEPSGDRGVLKCDAEQAITPETLAEIVAFARGMQVPGIPEPASEPTL
jgi:3-deoxy-D-arabino-heptulosonate 7-phosphate (DAHP) synthase